MNGKYNLCALINHISEKYVKKIALFQDSGRLGSLTYFQLGQMINEWKKYYENLSVFNEYIFIRGKLSTDWIIAYLGIVCSGNVAVIIDDKHDFNDVNFEHKVKYYATDVKADEKYSYVNVIDYDVLNESFYEIIGINEIVDVNRNHDLDDLDSKLATVAFSSGTTGVPKTIYLSHKNIVSNILHCHKIFADAFSTEDRVVPILPQTHMFGLTVSILVPLFYGATLYLSNSINNKFILLRKYRPTVLIVVPMILETLIDYIKYNAKHDKINKSFKELFPNLRYIICGASHLNKKHETYFDKYDVLTLNGYGMTECSPVITSNSPYKRKAGSVGIANITDYCNVSIVDGEIVVSGDIVTLDCCTDIGSKKVFFTGDCGYIDDEGFLFITGRLDNIIALSSGYNIDLKQLEKLILDQFPRIKEVKVVVEFDKKNMREVLVASFPEENNMNDNFGTIIETVNKDLPLYKRISKVKLKEKT